VVKLAALLHDIARPDEDQRQGLVCHARQGAKQAQALLEELGAPAPLIAEVVHCIRAHRFRGRHHPESPEARILFDADKLDAIGAVGIGRAFLFAGEVGARLHNKGIDLEHTRAYSREDTAYREYWVKLRFIKDRMLTAEGRRMARQRHVFMQAFFDQLDKEVEGLR